MVSIMHGLCTDEVVVGTYSSLEYVSTTTSMVQSPQGRRSLKIKVSTRTQGDGPHAYRSAKWWCCRGARRNRPVPATCTASPAGTWVCQSVNSQHVLYRQVDHLHIGRAGHSHVSPCVPMGCIA
jgi:hypothetical protein